MSMNIKVYVDGEEVNVPQASTEETFDILNLPVAEGPDSAAHVLPQRLGLRPDGRHPGADRPAVSGRPQKHKIIKELMESSGRRSAVLVFPALLNIAKGREVF